MARLLLSLIIAAVPAAGFAAPPPAVSAAAYHPNGSLVAFGTHGEVRLFDTRTGDLVRILRAAGRVTAIAFDPAGSTLAVASGEPGKQGHVVVYFTDGGGRATDGEALPLPP